MRRFLAYFFSIYMLLGSILPSMECWEELMYLPTLMKHFEKHQTESDGAITFFEFMRMHYATASLHAQNAPESEKNQHEQLPSLNGQSLHSYVMPDFPLIMTNPSNLTAFAYKPHFRWVNLYSYQPTSAMINPPISYL